MSYVRRATLAVALVGSGLAATTGAALADEGHHHRHHENTDQDGVVNADDTQTIVPTDVCGNDVPVNALGVQVPLQDITPNVPVGSGSDDGGANAAGISKSCGHEVDADS